MAFPRAIKGFISRAKKKIEPAIPKDRDRRIICQSFKREYEHNQLQHNPSIGRITKRKRLILLTVWDNP